MMLLGSATSTFTVMPSPDASISSSDWSANSVGLTRPRVRRLLLQTDAAAAVPGGWMMGHRHELRQRIVAVDDEKPPQNRLLDVAAEEVHGLLNEVVVLNRHGARASRS